MELKNEQDFRALPGLRWRQDEDLTAIAYTIRRKLRKDHLYFHGPGKLGIYIERPTQRGMTSALSYYEAHCGRILERHLGELDGILVFEAKERADIPSVFFRGRLGAPVPTRFPRPEASEGIQAPSEALEG